MGLIAINKMVPTPGAPVQLYTPNAGNPVLSGNGICVQADASNTGKVYIGLKGLVKGTTPATRVKVLAVLAAGEQWPSSGGFGCDPEFIYVDADTAGDGVNVAVAG